MNANPVIVDDDVDMEAVVILDEDDENMHNGKTVDVQSAPTVETIDLDDETPIMNRVETLVHSAPTLNKTSEISFRNNLENNRLMDKIVTTCINMENSMGMPRVVYKTLLPLYRDTNNRFKESDAFRALLKKTYKLLMRDPDHKFLHIKTLCEELKSGGLRRKVPFVTLAKNLKKNGSEWEHEVLTSSSKEINHNNVEDRQVPKLYQSTRKKECGTASRRKVKRAKKQNKPVRGGIKTRSVTNTEKKLTDIIDLDDSETETVVVDNQKKCDVQNDIIIIDETEPCDPSNDNINTDTHTLQETEEDSNKENNDKNGQSSENELDYELLIPTTVIIEDQPMEREVSVDSNANEKHIEIARLEKQIESDKKMIDLLEEEEVLTENPQTSPYCLCSKYKESIVQCYKKICELKGDCKSLVKRYEIRLRVAEGHPAGPAERLEEFLNDTIDETGTVQFPDFSDVVQCVIDSNYIDNLGWSGQQVIQEAIALFRQCGQALRKRRQQREYKDLMSLIRGEDKTDDPAEKDPELLAKLENNKLIAKIKEEEILNRYVSMENSASLTGFRNTHIATTAELESDKDSSDSESEQNIVIPHNITSSINQPVTGESSRSNTNLVINQPETGESSTSNTNLVINQPETGESSRSNINSGLLQTNNLILAIPSNNYSETTSSNTNDTVVNNFVVTSTVAPSTLNPMFNNIVLIPPIPLYFIQNTNVNENQCTISESSIMNNANNKNNSVVLPTIITSSTPTAMLNERETLICSDKEERMNSKVKSTVSETVVSSNDAMINVDSDSSSTSTTNIRNEDHEVNYEPCNDTVVQNNVSSTTDEVEENCDSSIISTEIKTENIVKREPLDIQSMLDQLEDGFVCQVFDIEDPFLVIEISSDGFTDDEEL